MPNQWGTAMPVQIAGKQGLGSAPVMPAGTDTVVLSMTVAALSPGWYYPVCEGTLYIQNGATAPSQVVVAAKIGAGAYFDSNGGPQSMLTGNAFYPYPFKLIGPASDLPWRGAGSVINLIVNPTAQNVTVNGNGVYAWFYLVRAPDQ